MLSFHSTYVPSVIVCLISSLRRVATEARFVSTLYASFPWFCVQLDFYAYYTQKFALTRSLTTFLRMTSRSCVNLCFDLLCVLQLTVYNCEGGPCYRCLFPTPPPPEAVGNCSDSGVLGAGDMQPYPTLLCSTCSFSPPPLYPPSLFLTSPSLPPLLFLSPPPPHFLYS